MSERQDVHSAPVPVLCRSCEARHRGICGALSPDQLVRLARTAIKHVAREGEEMAGEGRPVDRYSNVLAGVVKLTKTLSDGRQQIVGLQFAPDFVGRPFRGESAVNAEAATSVSLCSFPRHALEAMLAEQPEVEHRLYQQTLRELDEARAWMLTLGRKTATEKIASFLLMIARCSDPAADPARNSAQFELPLTRTDIADFLGLTLETVSRQFSKLRAEGIIQVENARQVTVGSLAVLESRAGG